jgi:hypothetical protein
MSSEIPIAEVLACCQREAALRKRVYPRWVQQGRMTEEKSAYEISRMEAACFHLAKLQLLKEISDEVHAEMEKRKAQQEAGKNQTELGL